MTVIFYIIFLYIVVVSNSTFIDSIQLLMTVIHYIVIFLYIVIVSY